MNRRAANPKIDRVSLIKNPLWILLYGWGGGFAGPHSDRTDHIAKLARDFLYPKEGDIMTEKTPAYLADALEMMGIEQPRQIITEISGFVPIFDAVINKYHDLVIAAVFGARWRYCQLQDGVCKASLSTIAGIIGVDESTVMRHTKTLCDDGYLRDLTPELRNRPHVYVDGGLVTIKSALSAGIAQSKATVAQRNVTIAQSQLSKDSNKDSNKSYKADPVIVHMQSIGMFPNSVTANMLNTWREKHTDEWIIKALDKSKGKPIQYADKVLIGWEANGYPKTREQQRQERKSYNAKPATPLQPAAQERTPADIERERAEYRQWKAEQARTGVPALP